MKKLIFISLSILLLIGVLLIGALTFMADDIVAAYRPTLEAKLSESLGAPVKLQEMKLLLVPRPKLSVKSFAVLSPNGDKGGISVAELKADAAFLPLLSKRLEISRIEIDSPLIALERVSQTAGFKIKGLDLPKTSAGQAKTEAASHVAKEGTLPKAAAIAVSVNRISIKNGEIDLNDRVADSSYKIRGIGLDSAVSLSEDLLKVPSLKLSMLAPSNQQIGLLARDISFKASSGALAIPAATLSTVAGEVNLSAALNPDKSNPEKPSSVSLSSAGLKVDGLLEIVKGFRPDLNLPQVPKGASVDINLSHNLASGVIDIPVFNLKAFGGELKARSRLSLSPIQRLSSSAKLSAVSLVELLKAFKPELAKEVFGSLESLDCELKDLVLSDPVRSAIARGSFSFKDGGIRGLNIPAQLISSLEGQPFVGASLRSRLPSELHSLIARPDTVIRNFKGDLAVEGGVIKFHSLLLESDLFSLRGPGEFNIVEGGLKLKSELVFAPELSAAVVARVKELKPLVDSTGHLVFPLAVSGRIPKVLVTPDIEAILKVVSTKQVAKVVDGVLKDKKLGKKLGGILGF
jgi:hypothetical protein